MVENRIDQLQLLKVTDQLQQLRAGPLKQQNQANAARQDLCLLKTIKVSNLGIEAPFKANPLTSSNYFLRMFRTFANFLFCSIGHADSQMTRAEIRA